MLTLVRHWTEQRRQLGGIFRLKCSFVTFQVSNEAGDECEPSHELASVKNINEKWKQSERRAGQV